MPGEQREQWSGRTGFMLAAIGSAVGLGNIWRFPYMAYENGGGAFLVPYLVALFTTGLPLLVMKYAIGHRFRGSAPAALGRLSRRAETIGWWQALLCVVVGAYYAVLVAWAVRYTWLSFDQRWGDDPNSFFFDEHLRTAEEPGISLSPVGSVAWPLLGVWIVTLGVLAFGIRRGVERLNRILLPALFVVFGLLVLRALFLPGAAEGLDALFTPDWSAMADGSVWMAAYGQVFFSLSIGMGIMSTYASYLRRRADLTGPALAAGFANSSFEILAGIGVFSVIGFMALSAGSGVDEVVTDGIGLAFIAFPQVISEMPGGATIFGVLFFGCLAMAGITSLISIIQVPIAAVQERTGSSRTVAVASVGGSIAAVSLLLFPTTHGLHLLDVVDHFMSHYGIVLSALVLVIVVAGSRKLPMLQDHVNRTSSITLGRWWRLALGVITPIALGMMLVQSLRSELSDPYGGYPVPFLITAGWAVVVGVIVFSVVLARRSFRGSADVRDREGTL
ncbi:sodium-dependent transporter [Prauserella endophytica]|uniref:Transporter n=1 Tax=Prauserella endophytica TaxID=1592324 RepID=A0ABY2RV42_9PSEU|nr:sodium-dependent transporter [Prauserella endophytica]TKG61820.1 sodium-dependent transporter [Prauserella endophytica]